ncbi:MAG: VTT domain-containing protein [Chloroflexi bacterium]|nr:VTT domain-containing protein [Chloroflexota bacterium]
MNTDDIKTKEQNGVEQNNAVILAVCSEDDVNIKFDDQIADIEKYRWNNALKWQKRLAFLESKWFAVVAIVFVIAVVIGVFFMWQNDAAGIENLKRFGYFSAFLISTLLNAVIILPAGNFLVMAMLGSALGMPWLVGIMGGLGAGVGESTGYLAGFSGQVFFKKPKLYNRFAGWLQKYGFWFLFVLSAVPFMFDLAGLAAGVLKYSYKKFFIATFLGRTILYMLVAYAGYLGWDRLPGFFS